MIFFRYLDMRHKETRRFYSILLLLFFSFFPSAWANEKETAPYPARRAIYNAQRLIEKNKMFDAISMLLAFKKKGENKGKKDRNGYRHYMIDIAIGNAYLLMGDNKKALPFYESAVNKNTGCYPAWMNLGKCCYDLSRFESAGSCFLKAYEFMDKKKPASLYFAAISFSAANKEKKALSIFERLLKTHKNEVKLEWKEGLVQVYLACNLPLKALPVIEELADKIEGKRKKQWQEMLLYHYITLEMNTKAFNYAKWLTQTDPLESKWWKALCHLNLSEHKYRAGLATLTLYSYLVPLSDKEKQLVADLNLTIDIPKQSVLYYQEIVENKKDNTIIKKITHSYLRMHKPDNALKWIERGLTFKREKDLLMTKGSVLYELELFSDAISAFEAVTSFYKEDSGQAWLMLGYIFWNMEDIPRSIKSFKKASTFKKQKKTAQRMLKQLKNMSTKK